MAQDMQTAPAGALSGWRLAGRGPDRRCRSGTSPTASKRRIAPHERSRPAAARLRAGFCGWLLLALLAGCAQLVPQTIALRTGWPAGRARNGRTRRRVPFFPQEDYQCGPAALATVLSHSGVPVTPEPLVSQVYLPSRQGSLQIEMLATPRRYGRVSYPLAPRYADLLREVAAGNPVIVLQDVGPDVHAMALRGGQRLRLPVGHRVPALGHAAAPGDALHRIRAQLDEERLLGDGGDAARPHPGHRDGRRLDVGRAGDGAGRHGRRSHAGLCRRPQALARQPARGDRPGQPVPRARRARRRGRGAARGAGSGIRSRSIVINNLAQTLSDQGRHAEALAQIDKVVGSATARSPRKCARPAS